MVVKINRSYMLILILIVSINSQVVFDTCIAYGGRIGECINIRRCNYYIELLSNNPSLELKRDLAKTRCGYEGNAPKVCCPVNFQPFPPPPPQDNTDFKQPSSQQREPKEVLHSDYVERLPVPLECGLSAFLPSSKRIVGGEPAKLGQYPWATLLGYRSRTTALADRFKCGGTVVTRKHVVTAAHCIKNSLYMVRVGELDFDDPYDGTSPVDIEIKKKIPHEKYRDGDQLVNDIALLVLTRDIQFTDLIKPLCLPTSPELQSQSFEDYNPWVAGWGYTEGHQATSQLMTVQLPVMNSQRCASVYAGNDLVLIDQRVLCVGFANVPGKDSCGGDSGGPLMTTYYNNATRQYPSYLIGVVSYGARICGTAGLPGVYTRVTAFLPWLHDKILGQQFN